MKERSKIWEKHPTWAILIVMPLLFLAAYVYTTHLMMFPDELGQSRAPALMMKLQFIGTIFILLSIAAVCVLGYSITMRSMLSERTKNAVLLISVLAILLLSSECFFLHFARSNGIGARWSYKIWNKKNLAHRTTFNFINSRGDNDRADFREPLPVSKKKKKAIWFIGDSFTFGFGLEKTEQTFPALVEQQLRVYQNVATSDIDNQVVCINLGDGGADTYHEKEVLFAIDKTGLQHPSAVVWQYFGNDIDSVDNYPEIYESEISKNIIQKLGCMFFRERSFLLDYIYWEYFRQNERDSYNAYSDFLSSAYTADSIVVDGKVSRDSTGKYITPFESHLQPLRQSAEYYKRKGIKFLVIIFPYLWKEGPENSEKLYARRLSRELKSEGIDIIDLTPLVKDIPPDKRVVNSHDPHPSVIVDQLVADTITKYFVSKYGM